MLIIQSNSTAKHKVSFSTKVLCIFAILSIIALNFPKSNVQKNVFQNAFEEIGNVFAYDHVPFLCTCNLAFNAFCITVLFYRDCYNDFATSFYRFFSTVFKHVYKAFL